MNLFEDIGHLYEYKTTTIYYDDSLEEACLAF